MRSTTTPSATATANSSRGFGLLIVAVGAVLRFATDASATWNSIHLQKAGTVLIVVGLLPLIVVFGIALLAAIIAGVALGIAWVLDTTQRQLYKSERYRARKQRKRAAKFAKRRSRRY